MITEQEFKQALDNLVFQNGVNELWELYKVADSNNRSTIEAALFQGIDRLVENRKYDLLFRFLEKEELTDTVMVRGMEVCGGAGAPGCDKLFSELFERKKRLSDTVLIKAIEIWGQRRAIDLIAKLLERKDLSDNVRNAIEPALLRGIEGYNATHLGLVPGLLERKDLSEKVRRAAEVLCNPSAVAFTYLQQSTNPSQERTTYESPAPQPGFKTSPSEKERNPLPKSKIR